jgi:hypothetical protein
MHSETAVDDSKIQKYKILPKGMVEVILMKTRNFVIIIHMFE